VTPYLLRVALPPGYYRQGQSVLTDWDFSMPADSAPAAYFNVVWRNLLADTFHDQVPKDAWPDGDSRWWAVVENMLDNPTDSFWDDVTTHRVETRDDILRVAQLQARDELTRLTSRDPHKWEWGRIHELTLRNATMGADSSPVRFMFNRGAYEVGGGPSVVDAISWEAADGYEASSVPSMRMVVPLDDLDGAHWINLTGASGHAYNDHYTDQTELWVDGKTLPWLSSRSAIAKAGGDTLTLEPGD
jgi:penicillin amidase